jgi:hypothetical protein
VEIAQKYLREGSINELEDIGYVVDSQDVRGLEELWRHYCGAMKFAHSEVKARVGVAYSRSKK